MIAHQTSPKIAGRALPTGVLNSPRPVQAARNPAARSPSRYFLASLALIRPTTVGMTETRTMPTISSSKCSWTKGMPPKK